LEPWHSEEGDRDANFKIGPQIGLHILPAKLSETVI